MSSELYVKYEQKAPLVLYQCVFEAKFNTNITGDAVQEVILNHAEALAQICR